MTREYMGQSLGTKKLGVNSHSSKVLLTIKLGLGNHQVTGYSGKILESKVL